MAKLTLSFKDKKLKAFPLAGEEVTIGREPDCTVPIDSLAVDPLHARITPDGDAYAIEAAEGAAVLINGSPLEGSHVLSEGDHIQVGKHELTFSKEGEAQQTAPAEPPAPLTTTPIIGWLQIMSGSHLGRTIRLDKAMTRIGKSHVAVAVIARRNDGYFLSHLEGGHSPLVNDQEIGEETHHLRNGDMVRIGKLAVQFFIDEPEGQEKDMEQEREQRKFSRVHFEVDISLHREEQHWDSRLIDVSLHGALIQRPEHWEDAEDREPHRLDIHLDGGLVISMDVHVAHSDPEHLGLGCDDIDVDSITHLRRLVELNLGNAELVERELHALG